MKKLVVIALVLFCALTRNIIAQDNTEIKSKLSTYGELAGLGAMYSINLDYRIKEYLSLRAGFTKFDLKIGFLKANITGFPISINYLTGKKHHGEFGLGSLIAFSDDEFDLFVKGKSNNNFLTGTFANIGYRYQPNESGLVFRATTYPGAIFYVNKKIEIKPRITFGLSIGYSF
jgi:hypothetical protein